MKIDKQNGDCAFSENDHVYWNTKTNSRYISVTTLIHSYTSEFDEEFWSSYKALEELLDDVIFSQLKKSLLATKKFHPSVLRKFNVNEKLFYDKKREIVESYETKRTESCQRGTEIHSIFENSFYKSDKPDVKRFNIEGDFVCQPHYYELDIHRGVYPEFLIYRESSDGILKVAGQIDLLLKDGDDIIIIDFKTNKEIKQKSFYNRSKGGYECMKFPLNKIMDTNFWHYSLQLSLYAYLLQQINPEFNIKKLMLWHIDHNGKETEYEVEYLKDDVEKMLKHYKKNLIIQSELNKDKPICHKQ